MRTMPAPATPTTSIHLALDVYHEAALLGMNNWQRGERFLREAIRAEKERRWEQEHAQFIAAYNQMAGAEGLALEQWRALTFAEIPDASK